MSKFSKAINKNTGKALGAISPFPGLGIAAGSVADNNSNGSGPGQSYSPGGSGNIGTYEEVYNRDASKSDPNHGVYAWGDDANRTYQLAYNSFKELFGRAPTQNEFNQAMGAFQGPNSAITGRAYLAQLQNQYKQNPLLDPSNPQANRNPQDIQGDVAGQFKTILGRDATPDELQHFSQAIQSGQTDSYGLSSFLKQQPEYTNAQDKTFREGLNTELTGYDQKAFGRQKQDIYSDYASRGLGGSSSLDFALTDLMGKLAETRGSYLANLSSQQYGGNKNLAIDNYRGVLDNLYNQDSANRQQRSAYMQDLIGRGFNGADYGQQMRDYNNAQASQRGYNNTFHTGDWINLGLGAANAGVRAYGASGGGGGGGFNYLNGGFSPYSGGAQGPYAYGR